MLVHIRQVPQGRLVGPCSQVRQRARIRASVVLPTPRLPVKRKAWAMRPVDSARVMVCTTASWPTTSWKLCGRYVRARTW
jgi:hypothetical protein